MTPPPPAPPPRHQALWVCLILAAVTLALYWPVTGYEFVNYDDTDFITANSTVQAGVTARGLSTPSPPRSPATGIPSRWSATCWTASSSASARAGII